MSLFDGGARTARRDRVPFREATWTWFEISLQTFGGPAGQIAVMQRALVDEKRWIGQQRFLHALNYCALPGVEMAVGPAVLAASTELDRALREELNAATALYDAAAARVFVAALQALDTRLARSAFLLGSTCSDADLRLWVRLARLDAGPNATGQIGPRLDRYPNLWRWAHGLYRLPAFRAATDFPRFAVPLADLPPWDGHAEAVAHDGLQRSA